MATFSLRQSRRRLPALHSPLLRTRDSRITSLSLPWHLSTVRTSTCDQDFSLQILDISNTWSNQNRVSTKRTLYILPFLVHGCNISTSIIPASLITQTQGDTESKTRQVRSWTTWLMICFSRLQPSLSLSPEKRPADATGISGVVCELGVT